MAQDPKIIYKTTDPKVQKILDTANGVNMTPNVSEVEAKQVRDKYDATSPKPVKTKVLKPLPPQPKLGILSAVTSPITPKPKVGMLQKIKNFFKD